MWIILYVQITQDVLLSDSNVSSFTKGYMFAVSSAVLYWLFIHCYAMIKKSVKVFYFPACEFAIQI